MFLALFNAVGPIWTARLMSPASLGEMPDHERRKVLSWGLAGAGGVMLAASPASSQAEIRLNAGTTPQTGAVVNAIDYLTDAKRDDVLNRTGLYDESAELLAALRDAINLKRPLYIPSGLWNRGAGSTAGVNIGPQLRTGDSVHIFGDGPGLTVIRDRPGQSALAGGWDSIFLLVAGSGVIVDHLILRNLTLDKNGGANGAPPSPSSWQQHHAVRIASGDNGLIRHVLAENVEILDKVGGGIVFAGGLIGSAVVRNCHARSFSGLVSQRGDIEFQSTIDDFRVEVCTGLYAQCEPNAATTLGRLPKATFVSCSFDVLDFIGYRSDITAQSIVIQDCVAEKLLLANEVRLRVSDSRFQVQKDSRWRRIAPGSVIENSTVINRYDPATNSVSAFYAGVDNVDGCFDLTFRNCIFIPGEGATGSVKGYSIGNSAAAYTGAQPFRLRFVDCTFSPLFEGTADCFRNGVFEFSRCRFGGWCTDTERGTVIVGGLNDAFSRVMIEDGDFSACTARNNLWINDYNELWRLNLRGSHSYDDLRVRWSGKSPERKCRWDDIHSEGTPVGPGLCGMNVRVSNPAFGAAEQYVCTASDPAAAQFRPLAESGIYEPQVGGIANCMNVTSWGARFQRHGNIVTVSGTVVAFPISTGDTHISISLPIQTAPDKTRISGTCCTRSITPTVGSVMEDLPRGGAKLRFNIGYASGFAMTYMFQYSLV